MANALRAELAEELETCPAELKRVVQPMLPPGGRSSPLVFGGLCEWKIMENPCFWAIYREDDIYFQGTP